MSIRTTVTLDEDVHKRTHDFSRKRGIPFRNALNELVRAGLRAESAPPKAKSFLPEPIHMGDLPSIDCTEKLLEYLEGPDYR
jgi:hypothetical protein